MAKIRFPWRKEQTPQQDNIPLSALDTIDLLEKEFRYNNGSTSLKDFIVKSVGLISAHQTYRREKFERCEYNLAEIRDASEADSYIKIALAKYSYLIYKAGWRLKSENQEAIDYLMKRFRLMSYATDKPMDILFQEIADDLVRYSNAFLIKSRVDDIPNITAVGIVDSGKPVGGYCRVDPASIKIKRDKYGNIIKYEQGKGENKKQWFKEDVIHFYMDKDANNAYGTPRIIAALDDVKLLRKIEGNVVALIHRFSMPLYQWKIGLPQQGFTATDAEIRSAKQEIESSSLDGLIITNEKTEIKSIGAEGTALNAYQYLTYFENRVFSALDLSASQMGRGGAKQDADSMEAQVHDTVKYIQRVIKAFVENFILSELLLEGGFDIFETDNIVEYIFEEISLETKIKQENHEILKYQSNLSTLDEARRRIGMKDVPEDENRLYQRMITDKSSLDQIDRNGEWQERLAKLNQQQAQTNKEDKAGDGNKNSTSKSKSRNTDKQKQPNKAAENNNRPANQYGTSSVKVKENVDIDLSLAKSIFHVYYNIHDLDSNNINNYSKLLYNEFDKAMSNISLEAMNDAVIDISTLDEVEYCTLLRFAPESKLIQQTVKRKIDELLKDVQNVSNNSNDDILYALSNNEQNLMNIINTYLPKTYIYTYVQTGKERDMDIIFIKSYDSDKYKKINIDKITDVSLLENKYNDYDLTFNKRGEN